MKLYSSKLSLFGRKIEIALAEKGLAFERVQVAFSQTKGYAPKHPDVLAINPKRQVPVLIDGDARLYDSTVILEYLEDAYPEPALYPRGATARAKCRLHDLFADEVMLVPLRALMHRTEPGAEKRDGWPAAEARAREAILVLDQQFATLDAALQDRQFLLDAFTAADISVFMAVHWSERLAGPALGAHPALLDWFLGLRARPTFAAIVAEIRKADAELSAPVQGAYAGLTP